MSIVLGVRVEPAVWPADRVTDVCESAEKLEPLMAARPDFLRAAFSTVVAFFVEPGDYQLDAAYVQSASWVGEGEELATQAPATAVHLAAS